MLATEFLSEKNLATQAGSSRSGQGSIAKKLLDLLFYHLSHGVFGKLLDKNDLLGTFPVMEMLRAEVL